MTILCYSVRLKSLSASKSGKAYLAKSFDGSEDWIPSQYIMGNDYSSSKSDSYWIAAWILEKKTIQYSRKKKVWIHKQTLKITPEYKIEKHIPSKIENKVVKPDNSLIK